MKNNVRVDSGLNTYMAGIYRYMSLGLLCTGLVAYLPQMLSVQAQMTFYSLSSVSWLGTIGIAI
jgi:FtsH-binding integral membrane protein